MESYSLLLQSIFFLIMIALLAYLAVRYGLRSLYRGMDGGGYMKVLERVPLDPKSGSSLLLVEVGGEVLLLGASQGRVNLLRRYDPSELQYGPAEGGGGGITIRDSFSKVLGRLRRPAEGDGDEKTGATR